ncbi:hypothetical protein P8452_32103 [Trifolium repens]|nr:hypothetical protein P8452_32103 [Trifolium repens]
MINVVQAIVRYVPQTLGGTTLALACVSNALNKPKPLKLDVSLPSFHDIRWSLARLLYLFNTQLERNVATFTMGLILPLGRKICITLFVCYAFGTPRLLYCSCSKG